MLRKICTDLKSISIIALCLAWPFAMAVQGQEGYFVGVHGGVALPSKYSDLLQDGYAVGAQYGYRLRHFRTALTLDYTSHELESSADGHYDLINLMVDFYYDFNYEGTFVPFVGAGIGYLNASKGSCNGVSDCNDLETGDQLAYQGLLGLGMQKDHLRFDVQYRCLSYRDNNGFFDNIIEGVFSFFL